MKRVHKSIFLFLILGLVLRLVNLNQSLWLDEGIQWWATTSLSFRELIIDYGKADFNPPLMYIIHFFWTKLFGISEISLRLPSVFFGLGTIYVVYKITQLIIKNKRISLFSIRCSLPELAALLIATAPLLIYYSQEARAYSLSAFLATTSIYYLLLYKKNKKITYAVFYTVFTTLMLYSHYQTWLLLPILLFLLPAYTAVAVVLFTPYLPIFTQQLSQGIAAPQNNPVWGNALGYLSMKNTLLIPIKFAIGRISIDNNTIFSLALAIPLVVVSYLLLKSLPKPKLLSHRAISPLAIIWLWLGLPIIIGSLISIKIPIFSYFRFLFIVPAFYILLAIGVSKIKVSHQKYFVIFLLCLNLFATTVYLFNSKFHREDWRGATTNIQHTYASVDPVIIYSAVRNPYEYYVFKRETIVETQLNELINLPSVWFITYGQLIFDPEDLVHKKLNELGFKLIYTKQFRGGIIIEKYINNKHRHYSYKFR